MRLDKHLPSSAGSSGVGHKGEGGERRVWRQKRQGKGAWLVKIINVQERNMALIGKHFQQNFGKKVALFGIR